MLTYFWWLV